MATAHRRPDGLLAWVLDDEARTRRLRSVLYVVAPAVVLVATALAIVTLFSPLGGVLISGLLAVPAVAAARRRIKRTDNQPLDRLP